MKDFAKSIRTSNEKVGNKYEWTTRNGEIQYFDYSVPFGGHKKGSVEKTSGGYTGYKTNGSIIISKKEFQTEEEAKRYVETGNSKVGNEDWSDIIEAAKKQLADAKKFGWAETGYNGWTKKDVEDLEKKIKELEQKQRTGNKKVGNAQKLYSDANVEIYDDGIVKLSHFPGYTQWAKDVDSIVRDEIRALEKQISDLKNAESKVKEVGKKYGLL